MMFWDERISQTRLNTIINFPEILAELPAVLNNFVFLGLLLRERL
jgi:hypothetical protein